jgi:erythromycin esterase
MTALRSSVAASSYPLATLDPAAPLDDLEPLARCIGDNVRIVAVGESVHAAHEFYTLRHRFIRFLVERMGFTAVVWESGFPEGFLVDDYLQGGDGERERVLRDGMTMHLGRCREMEDVADGLRALNASRRRAAAAGSATVAPGPVRFYGLDLPGTSGALGPALDVVCPYVEQIDPGFGPRLARLRELATVFGSPAVSPESEKKLVFAGTIAVQQYTALATAERNELTALLADLGARFDSLRRTYMERSDAGRYDTVRQLLFAAIRLDVQLRAVAALMAGDAAACEGNLRDVTMADNVEWILRREQRIIVLAHNGHIQRTPIATPTGSAASVDTLGVHLAARYGNRYTAVGTTCGGGEMVAMRTSRGADGSYDTELYLRDLPVPDGETIDGLLDAAVTQPTLLDLRTLSSDAAAKIDAVRRMRMQELTLEIDVRRAFDLLVHVPRVSVWTSSTNATFADERAGATGRN